MYENYFTFNVTDQVPHPYETTDEALKILTFEFEPTIQARLNNV
jgi:hypothetical protein